MEQNKLGIIIGLFLLGGIITWLIIPMSFQDTTIILESGDGGAPVSCLPDGGLVLAQNLTDLCDVTIESPITSQIIEYNGSQWINVNQSSATIVNSVTSDNNNTIGVVPTTGNVVLYPKYELLCQTTLGSSNATINCDISARKNIIYEFEFRSTGGTGIEPALRFNGDSGTNYSRRTSTNGAADQTGASTTRCNIFSVDTLIASGGGGISKGIIYNNQSGDRKLVIGNTATGIDTSATSIPSKAEFACKWSNTSNQITKITVVSISGTGSFNTDSVLTIWGYN